MTIRKISAKEKKQNVMLRSKVKSYGGIAKMSRELQISRGYLSQILNGKSRLSMRVAFFLKQKLDLDTDVRVLVNGELVKI